MKDLCNNNKFVNANMNINEYCVYKKNNINK